MINIVRSSKVRYIEGYLLHKSTVIDKIPQLSKSIPGDSNAFAVSLVVICSFSFMKLITG